MIAPLLCTIVLVTTNASCRIEENGSRIVSWQVEGEELLWNPPTPSGTTNKWHHGGIPLCWPWFGQCDKWPPHGTAWLSQAKVLHRTPSEVSLTIAADAFDATYTIALSDRLKLTVHTRNRSDAPQKYSIGIHPYFRLSNRNAAYVEGLDGWTYFDWRDPKLTKRAWQGQVALIAAFDHSFAKKRGAADIAVLVDPKVGKRISMLAPEADEYVVWNPGAEWPIGGLEFIDGFAKDDYLHFACLEPGFAELEPVTLAPGEEHTFTAEFAKNTQTKGTDEMKAMVTAAALVCGTVAAETITLPPPAADSGVTVLQALRERRSTRTFAETEIPDGLLSGVLWAANGFNRADKRTNATGMNKQTIRIYVCRKSGTYLYDAKKNTLEKVCDGDLRAAVAGTQPFAAKAPVSLIIAADVSDPIYAKPWDTLTHYDAGIVSGNIYLYCAANGLATVCRGTMDRAALKKALKLPEKTVLHLNHPVGYPAK